MTDGRLDQALKAFQLIILASAAALWWFEYTVAAFFLTMAAPAIVVGEDLWRGVSREATAGGRRPNVTLNEYAIIFGLVGTIMSIGFAIIGEPKESLLFIGLTAVALMAWLAIKASKIPDQR